MIVIQSRDAVVVLAGEALGGACRALLIARGAIGAVDLVPLHSGTVWSRADGLDDAAQRIGEEHIDAAAGGFANKRAAKTVVVGIALVDTRPIVEVFLQPEGVDGHGRAAIAGRAAQYAIASCVVNILFLAV